MGSPNRLAARLRGLAAGLLTAPLAISAHGVGGGALPSGAAAAQLGVLAATVGAVAAAWPRAADARVLMALLAGAQGVGHGLLSVGDHAHAPSTAPVAAAMSAAHVVAVVVAGVLIAAGDRLCRAVSRAVCCAVRLVRGPVASDPVAAIRFTGAPAHFTLLLAGSVSHRGPPAGLLH